MKNVIVFALFGCLAATTAEAQCCNQRRGRTRNFRQARTRNLPRFRTNRVAATRFQRPVQYTPAFNTTFAQATPTQFATPVQFAAPVQTAPVQFVTQCQSINQTIAIAQPQSVFPQTIAQSTVPMTTQPSYEVMAGSVATPQANTIEMAPAPAPPAAQVPAQTVSATAPAPAAGSDIVDTAVGAGSFNTLVAAVKAAGLVETLKGDGPFTVFAPTDEAFAKLPAGTLEDLLKPENKDKLTSILTYHVVSGKVMAADVTSLTEARTVNGKSAPVSTTNGNVTIGGANVIKTDISCSNGVIHVIDSVIVP